MRLLILTYMVALATSFAVNLASAADVTLCSGRAGGGYDGIIQGTAAELKKKGHNVTVINLGGSEDILNNLADGKCAFGPAQKDIHYLLSKKDSSLSSKVSPAVTMYNEAIQMVCSSESGYDELSDIKEGDEIIVDVFGSGSALTWENLVAIETEFGNGSSWSKATPLYSPLDEAPAAIGVGTAKCAIGVGKANIQWMMDGYEQGQTVSWVYDKDINDLTFNGSSLYQPVKIYSKIDSYKVPAFLFKSTTVQVDPGIEKDIKRIVPALGNKVNTIK